MSEALHCDCKIDETMTEYVYHHPDCLVRAVLEVAHALTILGNADAATSMGAIEAFGLVVRDGLTDISNATMGEY